MSACVRVRPRASACRHKFFPEKCPPKNPPSPKKAQLFFDSVFFAYLEPCIGRFVVKKNASPIHSLFSSRFSLAMPQPRPAARLAIQRENEKKRRKIAKEAAQKVLREKEFIIDDEKQALAIQFVHDLTTEGKPPAFALASDKLRAAPFYWPFEKHWLNLAIRGWYEKAEKINIQRRLREESRLPQTTPSTTQPTAVSPEALLISKAIVHIAGCKAEEVA